MEATEKRAKAYHYFEDFSAGDTLELGSFQMDEADMILFARRYDPQPFHVDPVAARASIYGGLIASGWHTVSLFMSVLVNTLLLQTASLGSPGVEELRWPAPVRPGDRIKGHMTVLATRPSVSRPEMGIVRWRGEARNQEGTVVLSLVGANFFGRREKINPDK